MGFDHDHQVGPRLAAALVNSTASSAPPRDGARTPGAVAHESAHQVLTLEDLLEAHGIRRPALTATATREITGWTERLRTVFVASDVEARCAAVNRLLAEVSGALYLSTHDGTPPHVHLVPDEQEVSARVRSVTAGGLAFFLAWSGGTRLGTCGRPRCDRVFVDASRGGRQRYCSARCGNTDAVARHRAQGGRTRSSSRVDS